MSDYNRDQWEALLTVQNYLEGLPASELERLRVTVGGGGLLLKEKQFTWPAKPILFDELEELFLQSGLQSPLMYCHLSPGLLRVKAQRIEASPEEIE
jgi:hypothetical protein